MFLVRWWRLSYRLLRVLLHLGTGIGISVLCRFFLRSRADYETRRNRLVTRWFAQFQHILHLRVQLSGTPAPFPVLLAANHISWLDILLLGAYSNGSFVAKVEIRHWPVLGFLAQAADTVFIERGQRHSFEQVVATLAGFLQRGRSVFIFPEGTTSDGQQVLNFRRRLFNAALTAQVPVQAVAIRYLKDAQAHPIVPYVGNDTLLVNLLSILQEPEIEVTLHYALPLPPQGSDADLARQCREQIAANWR